MKYLLTILIILSLLSPVYADDHNYSIGYAPICKHFDNGENMNEVNHGVFMSYDHWFFGTFNNSSYIQSWFIGQTFKSKKWKLSNNNLYTNLNLHLGLLYGYGEDMPDIAGWTIGAAPTIEIGYKQFAIETMVQPFTDGGVVSFMFKWSW